LLAAQVEEAVQQLKVYRGLEDAQALKEVQVRTMDDNMSDHMSAAAMVLVTAGVPCILQICSCRLL
jgi:hypothetical protein